MAEEDFGEYLLWAEMVADLVSERARRWARESQLEEPAAAPPTVAEVAA